MAVKGLLPSWLTPYPRQHLVSDLVAGFVVTILVIPQSLAYALLAGLPPQTGLYVSIFPVIAYALLGSSMVQAVGPVAITAIMTYSVLSPLAQPGSGEYLVLAATLSLTSGLLLTVFGFFRLGFLSQLLSRPVVSGFISGSAILIVISQLKYLLGVSPAGSSSLEVLVGIWTALPKADPVTITVGCIALVLLIYARYFLATSLVRLGMAVEHAAFIVRLMPLVIVIVALLLVAHYRLDEAGGLAVVGPIKAGLPSIQFFLPSANLLRELIVPTFVMALIGMVQGITMAQALAIRRRERIDPNAELIGLGASNLVSAVYGGMPVGGGLSRSAINVAAGAQTPLASIVSGLAMIVVVMGAAHWFERVPLAVLAASIMVAAFSMIDLKTLRQSWNYDRADALALIGTALGVLLFGLQIGIGMGIVLSMATLLYRVSTPHIAVIGRIPNSQHFRNRERYAVETLPNTLFVRIDERLFFGNLGAVETRLKQELLRSPGVRNLVLVMSAVNLMDATAVDVFSELNTDLAEQGIRLHFAEVKGPVQDRLMRSDLWKALDGRIFLSANDAFESLKGAESWVNRTN